MMPKMDGYELARALRAEPRYRTTPIVMVTSKDARIDALRGHDAGADAYLTKPADPRKLVATLDALLSRREKPGFRLKNTGEARTRWGQTSGLGVALGWPLPLP